MLAQVPSVGANLLAQIPRMEEVSKIILYQDKHFDGAGLPADDVSGEKIPLGARILKALFDLAEVETGGVAREAALEQLRARPGVYDPQILDAVAACFQIEARDASQAKRPPVSLNFTGLRVGHVLLTDLQTRDGIMIVARGNRITPALIHRLRNFSSLSGIKEPIYVEG